MAQLPKGGFVRNHDKPIHESCAASTFQVVYVYKHSTKRTAFLGESLITQVSAKNYFSQIYLGLIPEPKSPSTNPSVGINHHDSGQIKIFHQPRFPWNKQILITKPPFGARSHEVAILWPDHDPSFPWGEWHGGILKFLWKRERQSFKTWPGHARLSKACKQRSGRCTPCGWNRGARSEHSRAKAKVGGTVAAWEWTTIQMYIHLTRMYMYASPPKKNLPFVWTHALEITGVGLQT